MPKNRARSLGRSEMTSAMSETIAMMLRALRTPDGTVTLLNAATWENVA